MNISSHEFETVEDKRIREYAYLQPIFFLGFALLMEGVNVNLFDRNKENE